MYANALSTTLTLRVELPNNGEYIALEEIDDGLWNILFYTTLLGRFDEASGRITGADFRSEQGRNP